MALMLDEEMDENVTTIKVIGVGDVYKRQGLRPGELVGLRWADVKGGTVFISRAVNVLGEQTRGKNDNAVRAFVLSDLARAVLEQQRAVTGAGESVFCLKSEAYYYKRWQVYCRVNEIPTVSAYEMRHTFVSVAKKLPAGEVKDLVGHSEDMDTFGVYGHALTGEDTELSLIHIYQPGPAAQDRGCQWRG